MSSILKRKEVSVALAFGAATFMILTYFVDVPGASEASSTLMVWTTLILSWSMPLGLVNMLQLHGRKVSNKRRNYGFSVLFLLILFGTLSTGLILGQKSPYYLFFADAWYQPLSASMYSILAFYMMSACFIALKIRNLKSAFLLIPVILVMISNAPIGELIPVIPDIGRWFLNVQGVAVTRGVRIGTALGTIALGLRTILGWESAVLGILRTEES